MAVAFRAASTIYSASANSLTCDKPTGTVNGDVMIAIVNGNAPVTAITPPDGWNLLDSINTTVTAVIAAYYKVAASEGSNYVWGFDSTQRVRVSIASYSGASATINEHSAQGNASSYFITAPDITPTVDNCMIVLAGSADTGSAMAPLAATGGPPYYTENYESDDYNIMDFQSLLQTTAASTGARQIVMNSQSGTVGFHIALAPYSGPSAPVLVSAVQDGTHIDITWTWS